MKYLAKKFSFLCQVNKKHSPNKITLKMYGLSCSCICAFYLTEGSLLHGISGYIYIYIYIYIYLYIHFRALPRKSYYIASWDTT